MHKLELRLKVYVKYQYRSYTYEYGEIFFIIFYYIILYDLKLNYSTVRYVIKKREETGSVEKKARFALPKKVGTRDGRQIVKSVNINYLQALKV